MNRGWMRTCRKKGKMEEIEEIETAARKKQTDKRFAKSRRRLVMLARRLPATRCGPTGCHAPVTTLPRPHNNVATPP